MKREIVTYGKYFIEFYASLSESVQEKIDFVFELINTVEAIPHRFFRHMAGTDGLFEIRMEVDSKA